MSDRLEVGQRGQLEKTRELDIISIPGDRKQQVDSSHIQDTAMTRIFNQGGWCHERDAEALASPGVNKWTRDTYFSREKYRRESSGKEKSLRYVQKLGFLHSLNMMGNFNLNDHQESFYPRNNDWSVQYNWWHMEEEAFHFKTLCIA